MRWTYYPLADDDQKAKTQVLKNLEVGAYEHALSRKLLQRFSEASGPMLLIAYEQLDLDADYLYGDATYCGGYLLRDLPDRPWMDNPQWDLPDSSWMDNTRWGLIPFIHKYLLKSKESVVLCENVADTREFAIKRQRESRMLFFKEEVYHVLTHENAYSPELIEFTIHESENHWGTTNVCSSFAEVPQGEISSETFFDTIVANTKHIFTPALDNDGYLVWTPCVSG